MVPKLIIFLDFSVKKVTLGTVTYGAQTTNFLGFLNMKGCLALATVILDFSTVPKLQIFLDFLKKDLALSTVTYGALASNFLRFFFEKFTLVHCNFQCPS